MPQPDKYIKGEDFTEYATEHPAAPYHPAKLDSELNKIALSINALVENIAKIQRDDGKLGFGLIQPDALSASVLALLGDSGFTPKGQWHPDTPYKAKDIMDTGSYVVYAVSDHVSGATATEDIAANKLMRVGKFIEDSANSLPIEAIVGLTATDVQAALEQIVDAANALSTSHQEALAEIDQLSALLTDARDQIDYIIGGGLGGGTGGGVATIPELAYAYLRLQNPISIINTSWQKVPFLVEMGYFSDNTGTINYNGPDRDSSNNQVGAWFSLKIVCRYTVSGGSTLISAGGFQTKLQINGVDKFAGFNITGRADDRCYRPFYQKGEPQSVTSGTSYRYVELDQEFIINLNSGDTFALYLQNLESYTGATFEANAFIRQLTHAYPES